MRPLKLFTAHHLIVCLCFILIIPLTTTAQSYDGLHLLKEDRITSYYSEGSKEQAAKMLAWLDDVLYFYDEQIGFSPDVTLLVLSPADWSKFTDFPVYGMPHYNDKNTLIVASEDNDFWKSFIPPVEELPKDLADRIKQTYSDSDHNLSMGSFFDLLAIHELGHAYHIQGGLIMHRKWMGELFSNILLHTYVAENKPELLPALTLFPQMVVSNTNRAELAYTTLADLESKYDKIGQQHPRNYGWYQCRWHMAAGNIYDTGGAQVMQKLWTALKTQRVLLDNDALTSFLSEQVHQSVADVPLKWDER